MNEYSYPGNDSRLSSPMMGFLLGAVVGAGLALLLAPAPGTETRGRIGEVAKKLRHNAGRTLEHARDTLSEFKDEAKSAVDHGREAFKRGTQNEPASTMGRNV